MTLNLDRHAAIRHFTGINLGVFLDGREVTDRCFEANADEGWVRCFCVDANGKKCLNDTQTETEAATERLTGRVMFVRKADKVEA